MHVGSKPVMIALAAVKRLTKDQFPTAPDLGACLRRCHTSQANATLGWDARLCRSTRNCSSATLLSVVNLYRMISLPFLF